MDIYKFKTPVTLGERTIIELHFKKPKVKDFLRTDGKDISTVEADVALLSALTGESESLLYEIDVDDWAELRVYLGTIWKKFFGLKKKAAVPQIQDK